MLKSDANNMATHYDAKFVWQAMLDYKTYVQIGIYMGFVSLKIFVVHPMTHMHPLTPI
jgi:hypothetical protein